MTAARTGDGIVSTRRALTVWIRAVIAPTTRRAMAVWTGAAIAGAVVFGGAGMRPHDLTQLALHVPGVAAVLAGTWLLLFAPTARMLVREEGGAYLRSLPIARWQPISLLAVALVALQLPWLALWVLGEGIRGLAIVLALSLAIAGLALWRPRAKRAPWPSWRSDRAALRGVYVRALRRRATDALVRGVGLSVLAGLAGGLIVRNNALVGHTGAPLGAGTIAVMLVPACVGALLPLVEAHRSSAWLAASLGISAPARVASLATIVAGVYLGAALIAVATAGFLVDPVTLTWLAPVTLTTAFGIALMATRALVRAEHEAKTAAARVVTGAMVASAVAAICLGSLGLTGAPGTLLVGLCTLLTARTS